MRYTVRIGHWLLVIMVVLIGGLALVMPRYSSAQSTTHKSTQALTSGQKTAIVARTRTTVAVRTKTAIVARTRTALSGRTSTPTRTSTRTKTLTATTTSTPTPTATPTATPTSIRSTSLNGDASHTCGLTSAGVAYCWGWNGEGQLGTGDMVDRTSPVMVSMPADVTFVSIHANQFHTCALTSIGTIYCWGGNGYGQLGNGTTVQSNVPTAVAAGVTFVSMSIGARHTCAVTTTGTIYCWGFNYYGQLGIGNAIDSRIPTPVSMPGDVLFASIDAGGNYTCALTTVGTIYCWGRNEYGQLGNGTTSMSTTPSALSLSARVLIDSISVGEISACARTTGAAIYCWGNNIYGQLGDGTTTHSSIPKRLIIPGGETFASITAGVFHTCASTIVDTIYCWGYNAYGQLGTGDTVDRTSPVMVSMSVGVSSPSLSLGSTHTCMRTSTGTIYCWGDNADGQLGNGTTSQSNTPVLVPMPW